MNKTWIVMIVCILLLAGNAKAAPISGNAKVTTISSCTVISSPGTYVLNQSITDSTAGVCINITSSDVVFDGAGYTIDGTGSGYGIYVNVSALTNVTVKNVVLTDWGIGILYNDTLNSSIINTTVNSSTYYGIQLLNIENSTFTNNTVGYSAQDGFNIINTHNSTFTGNNISSSTYSGIYFRSCTQLTFDNNIFDSNSAGLFLESSSSNTITDNTFKLNTAFGLYVKYSGNNLIYNNMFNNTANARFESPGSNSWNITKTPGTNIMGGPYLGGNYWAKPDGTGFSETCNDKNEDGFCDTSYTLAGGNVDYLPLTTNRGIVACDVISAPGVYRLAADITNSSSSTCISITASNVVLDGAGYTVDGRDNTDTYGVYVYNTTTTLTNVTVKNLVVTDWANGIYYYNVSNGSIENNIASSNQNGIYLTHSSGNTLTSNTANSNNNDGIYFDSSTSNTLTNNIANSNQQYGILLKYTSNNNILSNNVANSNHQYGIFLWSSSGNTLTGNTANSNNWDGISLYDYSRNNTLTGNTANSNNRD